MRKNIIWDTVKNPRKSNGDLGDIKCDRCGCQTGAYALVSGIFRICKGCLVDGINSINHAILDGLTHFSRENKT